MKDKPTPFQIATAVLLFLATWAVAYFLMMWHYPTEVR